MWKSSVFRVNLEKTQQKMRKYRSGLQKVVKILEKFGTCKKNLQTVSDNNMDTYKRFLATKTSNEEDVLKCVF